MKTIKKLAVDAAVQAAHRVAAAVKPIQTHDMAAIVCPHCGYGHDQDDMASMPFDAFALAPQEETESMTCFQCDREFWVRGSYLPRYSTAVAEEELP